MRFLSSPRASSPPHGLVVGRIFVQVSWLKWELLVGDKVERADSILPGPGPSETEQYGTVKEHVGPVSSMQQLWTNRYN